MESGSLIEQINATERKYPLIEQIRAHRATANFRDFIPYVWDELEPGNPLAKNWHIDAICDHLQAVTEGEIKQLLVNIPPGCMKSWIISVAWPAWVWLHKPEWKAIFASYAQELSNRDSTRCRNIIKSDKYETLKELKGHFWELEGDQNTKSYFRNSARGERLALTMKGKVTGYRGDCTVVDDPHKVEPSYNPQVLREVCDWYDKVLYTRVNNQSRASRVVIMQRVADGDLSGHIREKYGDKYEHLMLPMEYDSERAAKTYHWVDGEKCEFFEDPREEQGELLFPERFPEEEVEELKESLASDYAGQCQQIPVAVGGDHFRGVWFRFWYPPGIGEPSPVEMWDPELEEMVDCEQMPLDLDHGVEDWCASWDCAFKDTATSDFVAGLTFARLKGKRAHVALIDRSYGRMDFIKTLEAVRAQVIKWPKTSSILVEDKANGSAVIQVLRSSLAGVIPVDPRGGKDSRANAVAPMFEAGNVYLPHPDVFPWVTHYMNELVAFPKGVNDDQVDATTQGLMRYKSRVIILT